MRASSILYFLPRVLAILFIFFLAIFALDVFTPGRTLGEIVVGLLFHLVPNFILILALIIAWKKERVGGILFLIVGLFFTIFFQTYLQWSSFLVVSFPVFCIGAFFIWHNLTLKKRK